MTAYDLYMYLMVEKYKNIVSIHNTVKPVLKGHIWDQENMAL